MKVPLLLAAQKTHYFVQPSWAVERNQRMADREQIQLRKVVGAMAPHRLWP